MKASLLASVLLVFSFSVSAQEIWTEDTIVFEKTGFPGAIDDPNNQDRITDNVWLTRASTMGMFNRVSESTFAGGISPADTEWAFANLQGNPAQVSAADFSNLVFLDWETALGGENNLATNILANDAVVHLITDDIYIDIRFLNWGAQGSGTVRYERASSPAAVAPEPTSVPIPVYYLIGLSFLMILLGLRQLNIKH